jgi:hypothetical protein
MTSIIPGYRKATLCVVICYIGYGVLDGIRQELERYEAGVANVQVWISFDQEDFVYFSPPAALRFTHVVHRQMLTDRKIGNLQQARGAVGEMGCVAFTKLSDEDLRFVSSRVGQPDVVRRLIDGLQYTGERVAFEAFGIPTVRCFALLPVR